MSRRVLPALVAALLLLCWRGGPASAQPARGAEREKLLETAVEEQLGQLEMERLNEFVAQLDENVQRYVPRLDVREILSGDLGPDPWELFTDLLRYLFREVVANSRLLGELLLIAVLGALLQNLQASFSARSTGEIALAVTFLALVLVGFTGFRLVADEARETVERMVDFMLALLPVLSSLLVAAGAPASAAVFHPLVVTVAEGVAYLVARILLPLIFFATAVGVVAHFHQQFPLSRLAGFLRSLALGVLGIFFSIFLGVMAVRGAVAPIADGVGLRAAKFLTGTFIPVAGKMFADAVEVVVGGSLLIKNAVGVVGMVTVLVLAAFPLMKIASVLLVYKLVAALVQPISDARLVEALGHLETGVTFLFVALGTTALMFFLVVTVTVGVGNLAFSVR